MFFKNIRPTQTNTVNLNFSQAPFFEFERFLQFVDLNKV